MLNNQSKLSNKFGLRKQLMYVKTTRNVFGNYGHEFWMTTPERGGGFETDRHSQVMHQQELENERVCTILRRISTFQGPSEKITPSFNKNNINLNI